MSEPQVPPPPAWVAQTHQAPQWVAQTLASPRAPWEVDPTENVKANIEAERRRQDDLRNAQAAFTAQVADIREAHAREMRETARRYEDRLDAKDALIRQAETDRINAIRAVDVNAGVRAVEVQAAQQAVLAAQLVATQEASRVQVDAAARAAVTSLAAALEPIQKDIRDLRDAQGRYQGGREQTVETRDTSADARQAAALLVAEAQARAAAARANMTLIVAALAFIIPLILYLTKK